MFLVLSDRRSSQERQLLRDLLCVAEDERQSCLDRPHDHPIRGLAGPPRIIGFPLNINPKPFKEFGDAVIAAAAKVLGLPVYTFDRSFQRKLKRASIPAETPTDTASSNPLQSK